VKIKREINELNKSSVTITLVGSFHTYLLNNLFIFNFSFQKIEYGIEESAILFHKKKI
jgi:hypothetical protein